MALISLIYTNEGLARSIQATQNQGWFIRPVSFGVSEAQGTLDASRTSETLQLEWARLPISSRFVEPFLTPSVIKLVCPISPSVSNINKEIDEIYLFGERQDVNESLLNFNFIDGFDDPVRFHADNFGIDGNTIVLVFNGTDSINTIISAWNTANPTNTVNFTSVLPGTAILPAQTVTFSQGTVTAKAIGQSTITRFVADSSPNTQNAISLVFNGTDPIFQVINIWNTANPTNKVGFESKLTGTAILPAQTISFPSLDQWTVVSGTPTWVVDYTGSVQLGFGQSMKQSILTKKDEIYSIVIPHNRYDSSAPTLKITVKRGDDSTTIITKTTNNFNEVTTVMFKALDPVTYIYVEAIGTSGSIKVGEISVREQFLLAIGQPANPIPYDKDGTATLNLHLHFDTLDINELFQPTHTHAAEVNDHQFDPNAHPDIQAALHRAGSFILPSQLKYVGQTIDERRGELTPIFGKIPAKAIHDGITFTANFSGFIGNSISLVFDGIATLGSVVNAWNTANPNNTVSHNGNNANSPAGGTVNLSGGDEQTDGKVVYLNPTDGLYYKASDASPSKRKWIGVGYLGNIASDHPRDYVLTSGFINLPAHGFNIGEPVFLSATSGNITNVPTSTFVGIVKDGNTILLINNNIIQDPSALFFPLESTSFLFDTPVVDGDLVYLDNTTLRRSSDTGGNESNWVGVSDRTRNRVLFLGITSLITHAQPAGTVLYLSTTAGGPVTNSGLKPIGISVGTNKVYLTRSFVQEIQQDIIEINPNQWDGTDNPQTGDLVYLKSNNTYGLALANHAEKSIWAGTADRIRDQIKTSGLVSTSTTHNVITGGIVYLSDTLAGKLTSVNTGTPVGVSNSGNQVFLRDEILEQRDTLILKDVTTELSVVTNNVVYLQSTGIFEQALADGTEKESAIGIVYFTLDSKKHIYLSGVISYLHSNIIGNISGVVAPGTKLFLSSTTGEEGQLTITQTRLRLGTALSGNRILLLSSGGGGGGSGDVNVEDLLYQTILYSLPFNALKYFTFRDAQDLTTANGYYVNTTLPATNPSLDAVNGVIAGDTANNTVFIFTPGVLASQNRFQLFAVSDLDLSNFEFAYSVNTTIPFTDGDYTVITNPLETQIVPISFTSLHIRVKWISGTPKLDNIGIFFDYDNNSFISDAYLYEEYTAPSNQGAGSEIIIPNSATYNADGQSLWVQHGNGLNYIQGIHYTEDTDPVGRKITLTADGALLTGDKLIFREHFGNVDNSLENNQRLNLEHNAEGRHDFVDTITSDVWRFTMENDIITMVKQ